jgi:HAD superfamily hydrolase (TIGR01509 family)
MYGTFVPMESQVTRFLQVGKASGTWPQAAVFDCDGLLIDTAECWREAFVRTLHLDGRELDAHTLQRLNGASVRSAAEILDVSPLALRVELDEAFQRTELAALPGAALLTERLQARMPLAVATNGPGDLVGRALERVRLRNAFAAVVSAETQARDKPAPDVYLAACAQLDVDPSDAIAFEDSAVGAQAARRAGLTVVLVPSNPRERIDADLRVPRLDDDRLASLLRLDDAQLGRARTNNGEPGGSRDARPR